jgi:hypothetical protein
MPGDSPTSAASGVPASTLVPTETPTPDPLALCPQPGVDTSLYINRENGYCLLVPAGFTIKNDELRPDDVLQLVGPRETLGPKQQEGVNVVQWVEYNGPAEGMDSAAYAREWQKRFTSSEDTPVESQATAGGLPATVLSNLPGYARQRAAFVVANGARYRLSLMPQPEDLPELSEPAQRGWDTMLDSIVFFPPERPVAALRLAEACPQETSDTKRYASEVDGVCFLYPADFDAVPESPGIITGGPVVGTWEAGDVRPSLAVGNYFSGTGLTPRQILDQRIEFVQPGSVADATMGGYPAVTFVDTNGAWPSRQAIVVVDEGRAYSILAQPVDAQRFPTAPPYVDNLWDTVIASLAFFDPWR